MKAKLIKLGHGLFSVIKGLLLSAKTWARCASRALSFSRTLINGSSHENDSSCAFIGYSQFLD